MRLPAFAIRQDAPDAAPQTTSVTLNLAGQYATGIAIIHAFWLFFYLTGTIVWSPRLAGPPSAQRGAAGATFTVVATSVAGMAIVSFCTFVLGLLHAIYPVTVVLLAAALLGTAAWCGDNPLRRAFWRLRYDAVRAAATPWTLALYALTLVLALPAIVPESSFDALFFHLVYAEDWARAHAIYVDQWVRFPYYAQNWIVLDTWMFELGAVTSIGFLGWLAGALSILGTYGLVEALAPLLMRASLRRVRIAATLAALAVASAPVFERWGDNGMVDVPIGCVFLVCIGTTVLAVAARDRRWFFDTLLCWGFFAGMKGSFLAFIPVGIAATWIAARATRCSLRVVIAACALVLALSVPWYAKNFIQSGDPIAPYLHLALHQPDSKWTAADMQGVIADLNVNRSPAFLAQFPLYVLQHPETTEFRENGVSLILGLLFLPGIVLVFTLTRLRDRTVYPWVVFSAVLFYAITYWLLTAHLGRYALLFYPAFAAFIGVCALRAAQGSYLRAVVAFGALGIAALPTAAGAQWFETYWTVDYASLDQALPDRQTYLQTHIPGYREEERLASSLERARTPDPRVYVFGDAEQILAFYFKLHGVSKIGDWFGPERWSDFAAAIDRGEAAQWLAGLRISGLIIGVHPLATPERLARLDTQLKRAGYHEEQIAGDPDKMYLGPGLAP
jgi:hypothetical protein